MDSETQEIIDYFLNESRESVAEVEPLLIGLEAGGGDLGMRGTAGRFS